MAYIDYFGTDLEVDVLEKVDGNRVKVRAKIGHPFSEEQNGRMVRRCSGDTAIVEQERVRGET